MTNSSADGKGEPPSLPPGREAVSGRPSSRRRPPQGGQNGAQSTRPSDDAHVMQVHPKHSPRPSTWPIFLVHFALPMALLIIVSNSGDIYDAMHQKFASLDRPSPLSSGKDVESAATKPSSLPTASSHSKYESEVQAAIERKKKKQDASSSQFTQRQKQQSKPSSKPTGPQSNPLYQKMEAQIQQLKAKYEESRGTPSEWLAAMRYADFLKHRDTQIHDGGTHQMEAIEVYTRAIELLESIRKEKLAKGEAVKDINVAVGGMESGYTGLSRELFVDYDAKSTEGMLCAAYTNLGKVYFMSNMFDRAVQSYEACLSYDENYLDALTYRAQSMVILGKYEEAGKDYVRVLETDTERIFIDAVTGLAKVLTAKEDAIDVGWDSLVKLLDTELPRQKEAYDQVKAAGNAGGMKHYADGLKRMHLALFAYYDIKSKDTSEAWKHLSKGNEYKMSIVAPFDDAMEKERVARVKAVFTPSFFPDGIGSKTRTPIFIIGFVRSGSTLLERILDAHPLIVGTGEDSVFNGRLDTIRNEIVKASTAGDPRVLHRTVKTLADDVVADMKSRWEVIDANMHNEEDEGKESKDERPYPTRFTDKMLTNYMNVGFIHLLFPNALILHVAREPMDSVFSAFKHDFPPGGLDYTSEFRGLARLYHNYRDIMEHWDTVLPGRVTHIRYEHLVTDLPNVAPKIIEAVGVPWDPTVLDFHKKKHAVNTLSTTQVRKGVYSHHFKGWKRYEEFLQPLLNLVGSRVEYDLQTTLPGYKKEGA